MKLYILLSWLALLILLCICIFVMMNRDGYLNHRTVQSIKNKFFPCVCGGGC